MATPIQNSPDVLCNEILAEAKRAADEAIRGANEEAAAIIAKSEADVVAAQKEQLDQARAEAARRAELTLATVPVEAGRMKSARIESLLETIHDEIRRQIPARKEMNAREIIVGLAAEALTRMSGNEFILKVSPADRAMLNDASLDEIRRIAARPNLQIRIEESAAVENGVIVQDAEGRQIWDNRLAVRLERMWAELRRQLAIESGLVSGGRV